MPKRDSFLVRIDPDILEAIRKWADDDMRSVNAQIEFILRGQLKKSGRLPLKSQEGKTKPTKETD